MSHCPKRLKTPALQYHIFLKFFYFSTLNTNIFYCAKNSHISIVMSMWNNYPNYDLIFDCLNCITKYPFEYWFPIHIICDQIVPSLLTNIIYCYFYCSLFSSFLSHSYTYYFTFCEQLINDAINCTNIIIYCSLFFFSLSHPIHIILLI